jgi:glycerate dehydrogenase
MKEGVILINEARGAVLDESAVAFAVKQGKIAGFGCDVYSEEPMPKNHPYYEIKDFDNVCLTPHCAWGAYESRQRCLDIICDNISCFKKGKPQNKVN